MILALGLVQSVEISSQVESEPTGNWLSSSCDQVFHAILLCFCMLSQLDWWLS